MMRKKTGAAVAILIVLGLNSGTSALAATINSSQPFSSSLEANVALIQSAILTEFLSVLNPPEINENEELVGVAFSLGSDLSLMGAFDSIETDPNSGTNQLVSFFAFDLGILVEESGQESFLPLSGTQGTVPQIFGPLDNGGSAEFELSIPDNNLSFSSVDPLVIDALLEGGLFLRVTHTSALAGLNSVTWASREISGTINAVYQTEPIDDGGNGSGGNGNGNGGNGNGGNGNGNGGNGSGGGGNGGNGNGGNGNGGNGNGGGGNDPDGGVVELPEPSLLLTMTSLIIGGFLAKRREPVSKVR